MPSPPNFWFIFAITLNCVVLILLKKSPAVFAQTNWVTTPNSCSNFFTISAIRGRLDHGDRRRNRYSQWLSSIFSLVMKKNMEVLSLWLAMNSRSGSIWPPKIPGSRVWDWDWMIMTPLSHSHSRTRSTFQSHFRIAWEYPSSFCNYKMHTIIYIFFLTCNLLLSLHFRD